MSGGYAITNRGQDALIAWLIAEPALRGVTLGANLPVARCFVLGNAVPDRPIARRIEQLTDGAVPYHLWSIEIVDEACPASSTQGGGAPPPGPVCATAGSLSAPSPALSPLPAFLGERAMGPIATAERLPGGGVMLRLSGIAVGLDEASAACAANALSDALLNDLRLCSYGIVSLERRA